MKKAEFILLVTKSALSRYRKKVFHSSGSNLSIHVSSKFLFFVAALLLLITFINWFDVFNFNKVYLSEGMVGLYNQNNLPFMVTNLISEPLVKFDANGMPVANLVSGWQVNNDATVYTFKLKPDLKWNDGSKVRSTDIKFNLPDVEISYPDEQTIKFKLADSFSPFPALIITPIFKNNSLIGLGLYEVQSVEISHGLVTKLTLHPVKREQPLTLPLLSVRFYPDEKTIKTAFELGEINSILGIADLSTTLFTASKKIANRNKLTAVFYNTKDSILSDKNMRKALTCAISPIQGEDRAKTSIYYSSWAFNNTLKDCAGDTKSVRTYLDKVQNGKSSTITLTTTPPLSNLAEAIIQNWKSQGIAAVLRVESGIPQNFQALLISESIPTDPDQYILWHSTQGQTNLSKYASPRVDKDLEDGRKSSNLDLRKEKYLDFQKVLADDAPAAFLYFPKTNIIYRQKVEDKLNLVIKWQLPADN